MAGVQTAKFESYKVEEIANGGDALALKWFGLTPEQIEARCGRFTRGARKGQLRGWIVWLKCREGGWNHRLHGVIRPNMIFAIFCDTYDERCELMNKTAGEFIPMATRVDTQYGHSPEQARADRTQAEQWSVIARACKAELEKQAEYNNALYGLIGKNPDDEHVLAEVCWLVSNDQTAHLTATVDHIKTLYPTFIF